MTKKDIQILLSQHDAVLKIDNVRELEYFWNDKYENLDLTNGKRDVLALNFPNAISGYITARYNISSRNEVEILNEIKKITKEHFEETIEFLNGTKCLPNNW